MNMPMDQTGNHPLKFCISFQKWHVCIDLVHGVPNHASMSPVMISVSVALKFCTVVSRALGNAFVKIEASSTSFILFKCLQQTSQQQEIRRPFCRTLFGTTRHTFIVDNHSMFSFEKNVVFKL